MSSLLDVLHKRPSRAASVAAAAVETPTVTLQVPDESELRLAAEPGAAPELADALRELPADLPPAAQTQATLALDATQARRWSDATATATLTSPALAPAAALATPTSGKKAARSRWPLLAVVGLLATAVSAYLASQLLAPAEEEGFLAAPSELPPVADAAPTAVTPAPDAGVSGDAVAEIEQPAPPLTKKKDWSRKAALTAVAEEPFVEDASSADTAWYDQPALPALPAAAAAAKAAPVIEITRGTVRDPSFAKVSDAYAALQAGDDARAETLYREVLAGDANHVDALLGLGALAVRGGRLDEAREQYRSVQRLDPKNGSAAAALSALPGGTAQTQSESTLKSMLREQPAAAELHFALGVRYVADGRWPDAQVAFFEAVRHAPRNADYAFNLAVSLDRLGQSAAAASYYRRALDLAAGGEQFDLAVVRARLATLQGAEG